MPEPPTSLRAFIAINLPRMVARKLAEIQRELQTALGSNSVRWTRPEQIHLTLKFLSHVPSESIGDLEDALRRACQATKAFELRAEGVGCFPNARNPRIVWVGLQASAASLAELQTRIESEFERWAPRELRPFQPHLTIGRVPPVRSREARAVAQIVESAQPISLELWQVDAVDLMQSELSSQGAIYRRLATVRLEGGL